MKWEKSRRWVRPLEAERDCKGEVMKTFKSWRWFSVENWKLTVGFSKEFVDDLGENKIWWNGRVEDKLKRKPEEKNWRPIYTTSTCWRRTWGQRRYFHVCFWERTRERENFNMKHKFRFFKCDFCICFKMGIVNYSEDNMGKSWDYFLTCTHSMIIIGQLICLSNWQVLPPIF